MQINLKTIFVRDLVKNYINNDEDGVFGYDGKLNIRPPYQREFIYEDKQKKEVIKTIRKNFPLNIMYWCENDDGSYELLDGQQRTISICEYYKGNFSVDEKFFFGFEEEQQEEFLNYKLMIYVCKGKQSEKLDWFQTINIAGEELTNQEIRNAIYTGPWISDAKRTFSKTKCLAYQIGNKFLEGSSIRQDYLEKVLKWICHREGIKEIKEYMAQNQKKANANELKIYFQNIITWVETIFPKYRKEMKGIDWGILYNEYKDKEQDSKKLEEEITKLLQDDDVTNKKGIYYYVLTRKEKYLNIRQFSDSIKRKVYEKSFGKCAKCGKEISIEDCEADHITPWVKGGKTEENNCQILCLSCNRTKSCK